MRWLRYISMGIGCRLALLLLEHPTCVDGRRLAATAESESLTQTHTDSRGQNSLDLLPSPRNVTSMCQRIHPEDLPPECACSEPFPLSLVVECLKPFNSVYLNDTIGLKIIINPCDPNGASVSIDITEMNHAIDYPISGIHAGEEEDFPIPGLAVVVPGFGHIGVDAAVLITGNMDSLTLKIGLNACVALAQKTVCASSIPGLNTILPWYVLSGTYKFGDLCDERMDNEKGIVSTAME